jgi:hypothetical protein
MEGTVRRQRETQSRNTHNAHKMMTMGMLVWSIRTSAPQM